MPPDEDLLAELRSALAHLDDPAYLESHPLTRRIAFVAQASDLSRGQLLRRTLRLGIEALDPGAEATRQAPEARSYEVLCRYAIARESMVAIAARLNMGERQAYRHLRRGLEALAQILSELAVEPGGGIALLGERASTRAAKVREEVERLSRVESQEVEIAPLLAAAAESARLLAHEKGQTIDLELPAENLSVVANRVMLRQAVLNLLSHMVGAHTGQRISVSVAKGEQDVILRFAYHPRAGADPPASESPYAVAVQLLDSQGIAWVRQDAGNGTHEFVVRIPLLRERVVLIVDDNEGLITLFRRYLRRTRYRVLAAAGAQEALAVLGQAQPDIVLLDVMMPDRDGWEVLQALRAQEAGRRARIIICSIIDDPQLAAALGADAFLHKPVDQTGLLDALEQAEKQAR